MFHVEHSHARSILLDVCRAMALGGQPSLVLQLSLEEEDSVPVVLKESEIGPLIRTVAPGIDCIAAPSPSEPIGPKWASVNQEPLFAAVRGQYDWVFVAIEDFSGLVLDADWLEDAMAVVPVKPGAMANAKIQDMVESQQPGLSCLIVPVEERPGSLHENEIQSLRRAFPTSLSRTIMAADPGLDGEEGGRELSFTESPESAQALRTIQLAKEIIHHG